MRSVRVQVRPDFRAVVTTLVLASQSLFAQIVPVSTWIEVSDQANSAFGNAVASAGDVNGDGYDDVIVGAQDHSNGQSWEGRAFVYLGGATGPAATPVWTKESNQINGRFGSSVAGAGDVNNDGYDDIIVGASGINPAVGTTYGMAYVYLGNANGVDANPVWSKQPYQPATFGLAAGFGGSVASAGDVNGDGYADIIIGAVGWDDGNTDEGAAFLYLGGSSGPAAGPVWTGVSNQDNAHFGDSVSGAGDVNGDGFDDIVVGASNYNNGEVGEGRAYVYYGNSTGVNATPWISEPNVAYSGYGQSVAGAGDVDGDGYDDIVVGAPGWDDTEDAEGAAFSYLGASGGLESSPAWMVEGNQVGIAYGVAVASAGDLNDDGKSDIVVSSAGNNISDVLETVNIYLGSVSGLATTPAWTEEPDQADSGFGNPVASAGDVNNDGYSDVILAASAYDNFQGRVIAYMFGADGDGDSVADNADNCTSVANASQCDSDNDGFGNRCDGDLNNNGFTNAADNTLFRNELGQPSSPPTFNEADLNCNGVVNAQDTTIFTPMLSFPPGPSGLSCAGTVPCPP